MRRTFEVLALSLLALGALYASAAQAKVGLKETENTRIPGHYIVVLKDSIAAPAHVAAAQAEQRDGELGFVYRAAIKGYSVSELSQADVEALRNDPRVKYVEADRRVKALAQSIPDGIHRIGAAANPSLDIDETDDVRINADVAVIDTGIEHTHPDLSVTARTNCVPAGENPETKACTDNAGIDGNGHGTHVAGTVGAIDNGFGVVGVAPGARLRAVRVLNDEGEGWTSWTLAGIEWVTKRAGEIEVANMSLASEGRSPATDAAIKASVEAGVVYVVAAGNSAISAESQSPANSPDAITVSAMVDTDGKPGGKGPKCQGADDTLAKATNWGSNWGSGVELAAPGACVYSTLPVAGSKFLATSYGSLSGTSMAAPHVAGAAALLAAKANPNSKADVEAIREQLIEGASLDWTDTSEDGDHEPLLYAGGTPLSAPEAATGGWQSTAAGSAILTGALNARNLSAEYEFEYGLTTSYGQTASASPKKQAGDYLAVKAEVGGLEPAQTYHYRLALTTSQGTIHSADRTLTVTKWDSHPPLKGPASGYEHLSDVSCPVQGWCMAVDWEPGSYELKEGQWTYRAMPLPSGGYFPLIKSVSCTSASNCVAVGKVQLAGQVVVPLIERWNGTSWSVESNPPPPTKAATPFARLASVSCATASECMAVGYFKVAESAEGNSWQSHVAHYKSGSWTNMFPLPPNEGDLSDISCPSASFCAVTGFGPSLIWNGTSWSAHSPTVNAWFEGVSCTSAKFCLAVSPEPHAQVWDGAKWSLVQRPSQNELWGVDCASPEHCIAAGYRFGPRIYPAIERWDGKEMHSQPTLRESERYSYLQDVDCKGTFGCAAVGGSEGETLKPLIAMAPNERPGVSILAPQFIDDEVILRGTVDPNGFATDYRFEWGPTTAYGNAIPIPDAAVGSGELAVEVSQALAGLEPRTTFHYRLVAESEEGVSATLDSTFTTPWGWFRAGSYPATVYASPTNQNAWSVNGGTVTVTCSGTSLTGVLTSMTSTLKITPSYSGCLANGNTKVTIKPNGCTYGWSIDQSSDGPASDLQSIDCPEGKEIEIARYNPNEQVACLYGLPAQGPSSSVTYQNQGSGSTSTVGTELNIAMQGKVLIGGAAYCGKGAGSPISIAYTGDLAMSASQGGAPIGLSVGGAGLYLEGKESTEPAQQPRYASETGTEPLSVVGSQDAGDKHLVSLQVRAFECSSVTFTGELTSPATELPLDASYSGCLGNGNTTVAVSMNSCHYVLNVLNVGPPYAGSLDLACANPGDGVEVRFWAMGVPPVEGKEFCLIKLPPQEGLGSVALKTLGSGFDRQVAADFAITGLRHQRVLGSLVNCSSLDSTKGTYTGGSTLAGL